MAKKEAGYYSLAESSAETDERTKARRYLEVMGTLHTRLWLGVSKVDWMIADSKKRIAQLESANDGSNITWVPPVTGPPPAELHYSKLFVDVLREAVSARRNLIQQTNLLMKGDLPAGRMRDPQTGGMHDMVSIYP